MQQKLAHKVYGFIAGLEQDKSPLLLRDIASIDSYNVYPDEMGSITKAAGVSKLYSVYMQSGYKVNGFALLAYDEPIIRTLIGFSGDSVLFYNDEISDFEVLKSGFAEPDYWRTVLYNEVLYAVNNSDNVQKIYYLRQFEVDRFGADSTHALWLFDDQTGTSVYEYTGNASLKLTLSSADMWDDENKKFGYSCIHIDGGTHAYYASVADESNINFDEATKKTVKWWAYVSSDGESDLGRLLSKAGGYEIYFSDESDGYCKISILLTDSGGSKTRTTTDRVIPIGVYHHGCIVYDGSQADQADRLKIYINADSKAHTGDTVGDELVDTTGTLYIGDNAAGNRAMDGYVDSVEIL